MSETYNGCDTGEYIAVPGPQGPQGQRGAQGLRGPMGPEGPQGLTGAVGPQGPCGPKGDRGPRGEKGDKGEPGTPGPQGPRGDEGPRGCNGKDGKDGLVTWGELTEEQIKQLKGDTGATGPKGEKGSKGDRGPQGLRGPVGPQGPVGPNGATGPKGDTGEIGPMGPPGQTGPVGPQGPAGGLVHSEEISESATWNSKSIADHILSTRAKFVEKQLNHGGVKGTVKGYAKDLVVHGVTVTNYITTESYKKGVEHSSSKIEDGYNKNSGGRLLYQITENINNDKPKLEPNKPYTVTFKLVVTRDFISSDLGDEVEIKIVYSDKSSETVNVGLDDGIFKGSIQPTSQVEEVRIKLLTDKTQEGPAAQYPTFDLSEFMLLSGDYTQKVIPRFFWGKRGVGDKIPSMGEEERKRKIIIESSNKNLIDPKKNLTDKWLEDTGIGPGQSHLAWADGQDANNVTFLVYCKQTDYILTMRAREGKKEHLRLKVAGYSDVPMNGEPPRHVFYDLTEQQIQTKNGFIQVKIPVRSSEINVLALYLGNLSLTRAEQSGASVEKWKIDDLYEELQLEEGANATPYEPYKNAIKELIIPGALYSGDTLKWDDEAGRYYIYRANGGKDKTEITDESFIATYDYNTYMYVKNKIPSIVSAKMPIETIHKTSYTIDEWGFEGDEIDHNKDTKNFLKLPNGFLVQWRLVDLTGDTAVVETFIMANNIVHVQATGYLQDGVGSKQGANEKNFIVKAKIQSKNSIKLQSNLRQDGPDGRPLKAYVMIISDNRKPIIEV